MARILYECLDYAAPAGGIRRIYRHVEILVEHGFDAFVLHHSEGFKLSWISSSAPVIYWVPGFVFRSDDVLVIPERHVDIMRQTSEAPFERVVLALNWGYIYQVLGIGEDWRHFGIRHVIAGSNYERDFVRRSMGLESTVLASGIDSQLFRPPQSKPRCQIAYMPKKNKLYFHLIAGVFRSRFTEFADVPFVAIDGVPHHVSASLLAESGLFLAHSFPEGLSRKALEAMACESVVVGHAGGGSLEFMHHLHNCYLSTDGDVATLVEHLGEAVELFQSGGLDHLRAAARTTALSYSLEREKHSVIEFWRSFLDNPKGSISA